MKKILSLKKIMEDLPVTNAGDGRIDGIGVGPKGEPGGNKFNLIKKIIKRTMKKK